MSTVTDYPVTDLGPDVPFRYLTGCEDGTWIAGRILDLPPGPERTALVAGYKSRITYRDVGGWGEPDYTEADPWLTSPETVARLEAAELVAAAAADAARIADAAARGVTLLPTVPGKVRGIVEHGPAVDSHGHTWIVVQCDECGHTAAGFGNVVILTCGIIFQPERTGTAARSTLRRRCRTCRGE